MIGVVIEAESNTGDLPNRMFYRINNKAVIEHTILNCLKAEMAHKVIVSVPALDRTYFTGSTMKQRVINPNEISALDRLANFEFYGLKEEPLKRLHHIALIYGLDLIVRVQAENLFIPAWLINEVLFKYTSAGLNCYLHTQELDGLSPEQNEKMYGSGLEIEIIPYWMLVRAVLYCENQRDLTNYLATNFEVYHYENKGENHIPRTGIDLKFKDKSQVADFEVLLHEVEYGADLGDVVGELDEKKSNLAE